MKKLRVGVIGIGDISNVYLNNLKKYDAVEVVACASRGLEKAQRKAAEHGIPKAYASGMELIADPDIDIILNLTTPQAHYEYNLAALKAGKHVYTEKPLAMTFEQGRELVSLAKEKGLLIGCAPDTFLGGRLQNIRELIDSGRLGRITGGEVMGRLLSRRPHGTFGYVGDKPLIQIDFPDDYAGGYGCSCISHGVFLPGCEPFLSIGSITSRMHAQIPWSALDATTRSAA